MLAVRMLDNKGLPDAAALVAKEHSAGRSRRALLAAAYLDPEHARAALQALLADGFAGFVVEDAGACAGVMCGRTFGSVGFVPAHGLAVDPDIGDPTTVVARLFAALAPLLLHAGALRFTIDHVDLEPLGVALNNLGFGRGSVFATQPAGSTDVAEAVDVRIGTSDDLDAIAELSQIELEYRSTPPIYSDPVARTLADARTEHAQLLRNGALHLLARTGGRDVGLLTLELTSPAPRLCPDATPYIGPTATHPSVRGHGIGGALVRAALHWAHVNGYETVSVDFDSPNPLSRPFWLRMGFAPTGYRLRRTIDASFTSPAVQPDVRR
jgi:GNAT superfamily N-acetyltransferase